MTVGRLLVLAVLAALVVASGSGGSTARISLTGPWLVENFVGSGIDDPGATWQLVDNDGTLTGVGYCTESTEDVECDTGVRLALTGTGTAGGPVRMQYTSDGDTWTHVGTIDAAGRSMSGTWTTTALADITFNWTARRQGFRLSGTVTGNTCTKKACKRKPLADVTIQAAGPMTETATTATDGSFELFLAPGTYVVTPTLKGYAFDPAKKSVELAKDASLDFRTCASGSSTVSRRTARLAVKGPFCRELFVANLADAKAMELPIHVEYKGVGWDPEGGPITVQWEGKALKRLSQRESFTGKILGTDWPRRDRITTRRPKCHGELAAAQGGLERPVTLSAGATGFVLFADLDPRIAARQVYCGEEKTILQATPGTIIGVDVSQNVTIFQRGTLLGPLSVRGALCKELTKNRGHVTVSRVSGSFRVVRAAGPCGP